MKKLLLSILFLISVSKLFAQPSIQWQKCLGGSGFDQVRSIQLINGIEEINSNLSDIKISPNPITHSTVISFILSEKENTTLIICDIMGKEIKTIFNSDLEQGEHFAIWDATDNKNNGVVNGVYLITISTKTVSMIKRVEIVR